MGTLVGSSAGRDGGGRRARRRTSLALASSLAGLLVALPWTHPPAAAAAPANDAFADAITVAALPFDGAFDIAEATLENGEPQHCNVGTRTAWYAFTPTQTDTYAIHSAGSTITTSLSVYTGSSLSGLSLVTCDWGGASDPARIVRTFDSGTTYWLQAGAYGTTATGTISVNVDEYGAIAGTITDGTNPIERVCVEARSTQGLPTRSATTTLLGNYTIVNLIPGTYKVSVRDCDSHNLLGARYVRTWFGGADEASATAVTVPSGGTQSAVDIAMGGTGAITGTVTLDGTTTPVPGLCISAYTSGSYLTTARSGADGSYRLRGLPPGTYGLYVEDCDHWPGRYAHEWHDDSASFGSSTAVVVTANAAATANLDVRQVGAIAGTITEDLTGHPANEVCVYAYDSTTGSSNYDETDATGAYRIEGLAPGSFQLEFYDCQFSGRYVYEVYNDTTWDNPTLVTVSAGQTATVNEGVARSHTTGISGTVTDATSSLGAADVCVYATDASTGSSRGTGITDSSGRYWVGLSTGASVKLRFRDCQDEPWTNAPRWVEEWHSGAADATTATTVTVATGATQTVNATLERTTWMTGTVTGEDTGLPIGEICVYAYGPISRYTETLANGTYLLPDVAAGDYTVEFDDCSYWADRYQSEYYNGTTDYASRTLVTVTAGTPRTGINASLVPYGTISGTVTDGTDPIEFACVELRDASTQWYVDEERTAHDGTYRFRSVGSGAYNVQFTDCVDPDRYAEVWWNNESPLFPDDLIIDTDAGTTAPQHATGIDATMTATGTIRGFVVDELSAQPVPGVDAVPHAVETAATWYSYWHHDDRTDADGGFRLQGLPAAAYPSIALDTYTVQFTDSQYPTRYKQEWYENAADATTATQVALTPGQVRTLTDATLSPTDAIAGTVRDQANQPIEDVCVRVHQDGSWWTASSDRTAADGTYLVYGLSAGNYDVHFEDCRWPRRYDDEWHNNAQTQAEATAVAVTADNVTSGIDAVLAPTGAISGTVKIGTTAVADACVYAAKVGGGWSSNSARTDASGAFNVPGLEPGDHTVRFDDCHSGSDRFVTEYWQNAADSSGATAVTVTSGGIAGPLAADVTPTGSISGTVTDEVTGAPIENVCVSADAITSGHPTGYDQTDALGQYQIAGLWPGGHRVGFTDCSSGWDDHVGEYYNDRATWDTADEVTVASAADTPAINAALTPTGAISGTVTHALTQAAVAGICVAAYSAADVWEDSASTASDGTYTLRELDPRKTHRLRFTDCTASGEFNPIWYLNAPDFASAADVSVTAATTTTGIDQQVTEKATISGTVLTSTNDPTPIQGICVEAFTTDPASGGQVVGSSSRTGPSGAFSVSYLDAGTYKLRLRDCINPLHYDDRWYSSGTTEITSFANAEGVPVTTNQQLVGLVEHLGSAFYNTAPTANDDRTETPRGVGVDVHVVSNDTDPDGDPLTVHTFSGTGSAGGTITKPDGSTLRYTPPNDQFIGEDTFTYTVTDGAATSNTATVTVVVTERTITRAAADASPGETVSTDGTNPSTANPIITRITTPSGGTVVIEEGTDPGSPPPGIVFLPVVADVTAPSEAVGEPLRLTFVLDSSVIPSGRTVNDVRVFHDGALVSNCTGPTGHAVPDPCVSSRSSSGGDATFVILAAENGRWKWGVDESNGVPVAAADTAAVGGGSSVLVDVLANDTDPDGDALALTAVASPTRGTATLEAGKVRYTAPSDFVGSAAFDYTIDDGRGGSAIGTVTVTVTGAAGENQAPVAQPDGVTIARGTSTVVDVLANDSDPDGDTLTIGAISPPNAGTAVVESGRIRYTPPSSFVGTATFNYEASDGKGGGDAATVTIQVEVDSPDERVGVVQAGETIASSSVDGSADPSNPIVTAVTSPVAGEVAISELSTDDGPQVYITAPASTAQLPIIIEFTIDGSAVPEGVTAATYAVFRNGVSVPACTVSDGTASPDPCVSERTVAGDDIVITVLTSQASRWNFGVAGSDAVPIERVAGNNRLLTAVKLAQLKFTTADTVVLARDDTYPDALAGGPLALKLGAPILLTSSSGLSADTAAEIERLGATTVVLLGGTTALSPQVEADLKALIGASAVIDRIAGVSRFDTAARIAARIGGGHVYVTEGANADPNRGWPDAVSVSALASLQQRPILLVTRDVLPTETADAMTGLGTSTATIVGGTAAVSAGVADAIAKLDVTVDRVTGADRFATSAALAGRAVDAGASASRTWLATGLNFPDGLTAGPAVARDGGVLLLIHGTEPAGSTTSYSWLSERAAEMQRIRLVGGTAVITPEVADKVAGVLVG